ncbi:MAG: alpha/beta hydrolase [Labilithrix sp.]|nr:alpha/beta hydrolase [Labilithrix sp.]
MAREDVRIPTRDGLSLGAWFFGGGDGRRPCVIMAHGFGATRACGLSKFAERFQAAGMHVLVFDYRFFGDSDGEPRQLLSVRTQLEDWASAIAHARGHADVDPDRVALWGTSYSGGAVVVAAARDGRVAAISSLVPMMDAQAVARDMRRVEGWSWMLRAAWRAIVDATRSFFGMEPLRIRIVGPPGSAAAITAPGAESAYLALVGPDWVNAVCARIMLTGGTFRPVLHVAKLPCPLLVQIGERDQVVPVDAAERAASLAKEKATVLKYPADHFDVYEGELFERAVADELAFFERHLLERSPRSSA